MTLSPSDKNETSFFFSSSSQQQQEHQQQQPLHKPALRASFGLHSYQKATHKFGNLRPTLLPDAWKCSAKTNTDDIIMSDTLSPKDPFVVAICGAKGVGKSTFLRYLLNCFLSLPESNNNNATMKVGILDADLGQPELGPPGMVTLTTPITRPLLSPPHMHMVIKDHWKDTATAVFSPVCADVQQHAHFLGSTSASASDPLAYQQAVGSLFSVFVGNSTNSDKRRVLLVNLHGWVKGLGGQLLLALLQQTLQGPSHVVQLQGPLASQRFELTLPPDTLTRVHVVPSYHLLYCTNNKKNSNANNNHGTSDPTCSPPPPPVVLPPAALRTLRLSTYFLNNDVSLWERVVVATIQNLSLGSYFQDDNLEIANRLAAMPPYVVPLTAVSLLDPLSGVALSDGDLYSWNATLVGLCCRASEHKVKGLPWYLLPCLGLGLIRSIDVTQRRLYILTPVHPQLLPQVNVLVKSHGMGLPLEMTYRGVDSECFPYHQQQVALQPQNPGENAPLLLGMAPVKSRNSIGRRLLINSGNHEST